MHKICRLRLLQQPRLGSEVPAMSEVGPVYPNSGHSGPDLRFRTDLVWSLALSRSLTLTTGYRTPSSRPGRSTSAAEHIAAHGRDAGAPYVPRWDPRPMGTAPPPPSRTLLSAFGAARARRAWSTSLGYERLAGCRARRASVLRAIAGRQWGSGWKFHMNRGTDHVASPRY